MLSIPAEGKASFLNYFFKGNISCFVFICDFDHAKMKLYDILIALACLKKSKYNVM